MSSEECISKGEISARIEAGRAITKAHLDNVKSMLTDGCEAFDRLNDLENVEEEAFLEKITNKLRIQCLEDELEEKKRAIGSLSGIIVANNQTIRERELNVSKNHELIEEQQRTIDSLGSANEEQHGTIASLNLVIKELQPTVNSLDMQLNTLAWEYVELRDSIYGPPATSNRLRDRIHIANGVLGTARRLLGSATNTAEILQRLRNMFH